MSLSRSCAWLLALSAVLGWSAEPTSAFARAKRTSTVAILPFANANQDAVKDGLGLSVASMFGTHLKNETNFVVLERAQLTRILDEQAMSATGLSDAQRQQLGRLLQVEAILTGEVSRFGDLIQLDARLISVETGQVLVAEYAQVPNYSLLRQSIVQIAKSLELKYLRRWMGDLSISVQPVEGEVYLDDQYLGKANLKEPLRMENLLEGKYQLKVLASGYQTATEWVEISPKLRRDVQIALKALPGSLRFVSEPAGAIIQVNKKPIGVTPMQLDSVAEGQYRVLFEVEGFQPYEREVEVRSGQQTEVKGALKIKPGKIMITSEPLGADAFVNDRRVGITPVVVDQLQPGTMTVRVEKARFSPAKDVVTVKPGEEFAWKGELSPLKGLLSVIPLTDSVQVQIVAPDGRILSREKAPFHKKELDIGDYSLELTRPLFDTLRIDVSIREDAEARMEPVLHQRPAQVRIGSNGATADVWIDSAYVGRTGLAETSLAQGEHTVQWSSFFNSGRQRLKVGADEHKVVDLAAAEPASHRWMIALGVAASALLLLATGR